MACVSYITVLISVLLLITVRTNANTNATTPASGVATTAATTPTTAAPSTTRLLSTMTPQEKHKLWCDYNFLTWLPNNTACIKDFKIDKDCYKHEMNISSEYLRCKSILKIEISNPIAKYNSMFFQAYIRFFGKVMLTQFMYERENDAHLKVGQTQRKVRLVYSNLIWITGFQFRYSDMSWPDYHNGFKRKKWNRRNDTIRVPYGGLPRGEYRYRFALYDSIWTQELSRELVRLKRKWAVQHTILYGEFVSYDTEPNLYFKKTQKINSAVLQLYVQPVPQNPLPSSLTIALNHLDRNMENPVCVYWQDIAEFSTEVIPPHGYWSNYGMEMKATNKTMTICYASHYGSFALLMQPILPPVDTPMSTVDILTIIFTLFAVIILVGYVISMAMLECYHSIQCQIYIYIAVSLLFADLFYFIGIFARSSFDTCTNLMTLYELTYMFVVTWYMIDAIHQLNMITALFNPKTNANAFYIIVGVGLPLAVLVAMLEFPYPEFTELPYCWPNVEGAYYLYFIGPLAVVILVTAFLRMLTFEKVRNADKRKMEDVNYIRAFLGTKATGVILITCILYWIIGAVGIKSEKKSSDVVQVILAAIQIIMSGEIMYYYFYKNDEVADALEKQKRIVERMRLNKMDHLAGVMMDVKYVPNTADATENVPTQSDPKETSSDRKPVDKFDSMFGLNTYAHSTSPDSEPDRHRRDEFTSETSLIR